MTPSLLVFLLLEQDEFATLPAVVPEGPIAILGLVCFFSCWGSCAILFFISRSTLFEPFEIDLV